MGLPPCFHLADSVFPRVRADAAQRLVAQGWSQAEVAKALGVSQAMVSKYRARTGPEQDPLVLRLSEQLLEDLGRPATGPSPWCSTLGSSLGPAHAEDALQDLLGAEQALLAAAPVAIVPEVGLNLARALPDARSASEVLAYPARIVSAGDRLVRPAPPEFGASRHLAACLLVLRRRDPSLHALGNIRGSAEIAGLAGPDAVLLPHGPREDAFAEAVARAPGPVATVHDPGAVGIEPCLYIAGSDAMQVVARILDIARKVHP